MTQERSVATYGNPIVPDPGAGKESAPRILHRPQPWGRKELLRRAYAEAASDEAYAKEMAEIDRAFDVTVGDGLETD
ncbi:MAG TPA: hypothetical protein VFJ16_20810 [Longimicrobium sp.]|nr:hypothetical protein [Longimicrobium sp.]